MFVFVFAMFISFTLSLSLVLNSWDYSMPGLSLSSGMIKNTNRYR